MKKILYGLFFTFIFLISVNDVRAVKKCYYKTTNGVIDFRVEVNTNGEGTAILQNDYNKDDVEDDIVLGENQKQGASWSVDYVLYNGECNNVLEYKINTGKNELNFMNSVPIYPNNSNKTFYLKLYNNEETNPELANAQKYEDEILKKSITCNYENEITFKIGVTKSGILKFSEHPRYNNVKQFYKIGTLNFVSYEEKKLKCPQVLFYRAPASNLIEYSFDSTLISEPQVLKLNQENNNMTDIEVDYKIKSCLYPYTYLGENYEFEIINNGKDKYGLAYAPYNGSWFVTSNKLMYLKSNFINSMNFDSCSKIDIIHPNVEHRYGAKIDKDGISGIKMKTYDELMSTQNLYTGQAFKTKIQNIKAAFNCFNEWEKNLSQKKQEERKKNNKWVGNKWQSYKIKIDNNIYELKNDNIVVPEWNDEKINECTKYPESFIEKETRDIRLYCNDIYKLFASNIESPELTARFEECRSFEFGDDSEKSEKFTGLYKKMVEDGIIGDQSKGCELVSSEMSEFIQKILSIIKIVGPVLAIALGTMDFVKAVASGDADKEMKTAFSKFTKRIIAAVLLFLIPFILAFLMDLFLKNKDGYDPENPFCVPIDWTKK